MAQGRHVTLETWLLDAEYLPAEHGTQVAQLPDALLRNFPAGHGVQTLDPAALSEPVGQVVHAVEVTPPAAYVPQGHGIAFTAGGRAFLVPAPVVGDPVLSTVIFPDPAGVHAVEPEYDQYPAGQALYM